MSTTRINELPAAAGVASNDYLAIDNTSGVSQKATAAQLVNVDNTLSVAGRPADAKATGNAISAEASARAQAISEEAAARESVGTEVDELKSALEGITLSKEDGLAIWEVGGLVPSTGAETTTITDRIRSNYINARTAISALSGFQYMIFAYTNVSVSPQYVGAWDGSQLSTSGVWLSDLSVLSSISDFYSYRIIVRAQPNRTMTPADGQNILTYRFTDTSLIVSGFPADAKATGDSITSVNSAITAEATAREAAVSAEASAREAADTALNGSIIAEATAREAADNELKSAISMYTLSWESGGLYSATGIEYASSSVSRTPFIQIQPGATFYYESQDTALPLTIFEFATNETTTESVNNRLVISDQSYSKRKFYKVGESTNFIRLQSGVSVDVIRGKIDIFNLASPYANVIARFCPPYVTPEMFSAQSTTDVQMIQSAVNYAFDNKCDIVFPRMYTLNSNEYVYVNKYSGVPDTSSRFATRFIGINGGGIIKRATGHIFTASSTYAYSGDFQFMNLNFESDSGAGCNVFNLNVMMRMLVENCLFKNVDSVARNDYVPNDTRTYYCQDIAYRNCTIIGGTGYAFHSRGCYAVTFDGLTIEHRDGGIRLGVNTNDNYYTRCRNLVIQNCVIEGISGENIRTVENGTPTNGWAINIQNPIQVLIQGCYFERNYGNILLRNASTGSFYSADVRDCLLSGTFPVERYGNASEYQDIMDNPYLVTLGGNAGDYQIEKCVSQFGGILNVGTSISGVILYLANNYNSNSTGARTYASYTYDASSGTWKGNNEQVDSITITGKNNGMSQCKTYQIVSLT